MEREVCSPESKTMLFVIVGLLVWLVVINVMYWSKFDWIIHNTLACVAVISIPIMSGLATWFIWWVILHFIKKYF